MFCKILSLGHCLKGGDHIIVHLSFDLCIFKVTAVESRMAGNVSKGLMKAEWGLRLPCPGGAAGLGREDTSFVRWGFSSSLCAFEFGRHSGQHLRVLIMWFHNKRNQELKNKMIIRVSAYMLKAYLLSVIEKTGALLLAS